MEKVGVRYGTCVQNTHHFLWMSFCLQLGKVVCHMSFAGEYCNAGAASTQVKWLINYEDSISKYKIFHNISKDS
jgi:hypothetical protein